MDANERWPQQLSLYDIKSKNRHVHAKQLDTDVETLCETYAGAKVDTYEVVVCSLNLAIGDSAHERSYINCKECLDCIHA